MNDKINVELNSLMNQLEGFITTKTVVGEPIHIDETILVPLVDVSFAAATAGTTSNKFTQKNKEKEKKVDGESGGGAGGLGAKVTPSAMLVIQNGTTQLINVKSQDSLSKIIDMIPGIVAKMPDVFSKFTKGDKNQNESTSTSLKENNNETADQYHNISK